MQQNCAIESNRLRELGQFCNSACDQDPAPIHESCFRWDICSRLGGVPDGGGPRTRNPVSSLWKLTRSINPENPGFHYLWNPSTVEREAFESPPVFNWSLA
jgi:hypothetical protein